VTTASRTDYTQNEVVTCRGKAPVVTQITSKTVSYELNRALVLALDHVGPAQCRSAYAGPNTRCELGKNSE
jgi:hypothetical protein